MTVAELPSESTSLDVQSLSLSFGGLKALDDVTFSVDAARTLAIIGPNGAGKTSILNCLAGAYRPQIGSARLDGIELIGMSPTAIARLGLARTFQNLGVVPGLTVMENLLLGRHLKMRAGFVTSSLGFRRVAAEENVAADYCRDLMDLLELSPYARRPVGSLPYGLQKRVDLGRALAAEPSLLILDEPVAGMNASERSDISELVGGLRRNGPFAQVSVLLVEHDIDFVSRLADTVMVMDFGRAIFRGTPDQVRSDPEVIKAYLGEETSMPAKQLRGRS